jgi:hypothetical protein
MVSSLVFVTTLVFQAQGSSTTEFRPTADVRQPNTPTPAEAPKNVTVEMRGDIFIARKM